jgi:intracellular septation protein A
VVVVVDSTFLQMKEVVVLVVLGQTLLVSHQVEELLLRQP